MKKILLIISLIGLTISVKAQQTFVTNSMAAGLREVVAEAIVVNSIIVSGSSNTMIRIYDGSVTNVIAAYTNVIRFPTNVVTTFIGPTGITNNWTNTVLTTTATAVGAATNNVPPLLVLAVFAGQPPQIYNGPYLLTRTLNVSNDLGGLNMIVNYRQP